MEYFIAFKNTDFVIKAERFLIAQKLRVVMQPLPSQLHSGCGLCLRIDPCDVKLALRILAEGGVEETMLFSRDPKDNQYSYVDINEVERNSNGSMLGAKL
ncbi:MAG: DUF3343 domain-containing protein [Dehalococcoidia bacterium]|nr:DUF3343 domain-containing protein [Dehalococcoidia bacterium]